MENQNNNSPEKRKFKVWIVILLIGLVLFGLFGCGAYSVIPLSLKEARDYIVEKEESFSYPLRNVVIASGVTLKGLDFEISRLELQKDRGLIKASSDSTNVVMKFESITPRLTQLKSKVSDGNGVRSFSSEEEIFNNTRRKLESGDSVRPNELTTRMMPVFIEPDRKSAIVAYIAYGEKVAIVERGKDYSRIALESGGEGYVMTGNLATDEKRTGK